MNPTAIYSKSGKGVQEAAGKTSLLARPDRAVLAAIDGRATLGDVAQKVGKAFDSAFQQVINKLDKDGFIREVSAGTAAAASVAKPAAGKAAPAKPAARAEDPASDLDFSMLGGPSKPAPAAPKAPPPRPAAAPPPPPPPPPKEQESALFKARQEAEAKAVAERERQRKEAEGKVRAETEAKLRAEAEARARAEAEARVAAEAEAKVKAAREEAERVRREAEERERKAREEAERLRKEAEERERRAREEAERKAREEAERIRREAEEKARREAEEKARREQEELRKRLEEERKAREEAERKAREDAERFRREAEAEAERARKELEEERRRLEEDKRAREEEDRREEEERAARRRAREEEEAREAAEREARRKAREEEDALEEQRAASERAAKKPKKAEPPPPEKSGEEFADSLMADLDSFNTREEAESKEKAEAERKAKEQAERRAREDAERREKEEAAQRAKEEKRRAKEEKERKKREEEERLRREEEEEKARIREEEERRKKEAEERAAKAKEDEALARRATSSTAGGYVSEDARRKRQLEVGPRDPSLVNRKQRSWGRPVAVTLFVLLLIALGVAHVMPVSTVDYERAASEAIGRPVRIGSARLWLVSGLQVRMENVTAGEVKIGRVIAHPTIGSLTEPRKVFSLIELEGVTVPQDAAGEVLFSRAKGDNFSVARVAARRLQLPGALALPKELEAEVSLDASGAPRLVTVRGDDGLVARLEVQGKSIEFSVEAGSFAVPFAPEISFTTFGMKGSANESGVQIKQWDGQALNGTLSGTARVRWGGTWRVDGVITARGINAAVFAPALLSEGRGEGTGKFAMSGVEPAKLGAGAQLDGNFTISKGVLGSFDLSRAIQTGGKQAQGRTQFAEMNGQVSYDRGEVELRNVTIGAGALNAGASALISQKGALSGRIVADVRTASQTLRATLLLGGTVKEPQVRN